MKTIDATEQRLVLVWAALIVLTLASWAGSEGVAGLQPMDAGVLVVVFATIKIRLIVIEFMDIRHAPWPLRLALESWVMLVGGVMLGLLLWTDLRRAA